MNFKIVKIVNLLNKVWIIIFINNVQKFNK